MMKKLAAASAILGMLALTSACAMPTRAQRQGAAPPAAEPSAPVAFSGDGKMNTEKVQLSGDYSVMWSTQDDCYFSARVVGESGSDNVFAATGPIDGSTNLYGLSGSYYVKMITGPSPKCRWSLNLEPQ